MTTRYPGLPRDAGAIAVVLALVSACAQIPAPPAASQGRATPTTEASASSIPASASASRARVPAASVGPRPTPLPTPSFISHSLGEGAVRITVGEAPEAAFVAYDSVWVANHRGGSASRIDPLTNDAITIPFRPGDRVGNLLAAGAGSVWFDVFTGVGRIDAATNKATVISTGPTFREAGGPAFAADRLWVYQPPYLLEFDPETSAQVNKFEIGSVDPESRMTAGAGSLWIAESRTGIYRFDPVARRVIAHLEDVPAYKIVSDGEWVWTVDEGAGTVALVDTASNTVGEPVRVRDTPGGILPRVVDGNLWILLSDAAGVVFVDRAENRVTGRWRSPDPFSGYLAAGFDSLWVPIFHRNQVWRIDQDELLATR